MTALGPYSMSTLVDKISPVATAVVATSTPGTLLDLIMKRYAWLAQIIITAGLANLYNEETTLHTLFVPGGAPRAIHDRGEAYEFCKQITVKGKISPEALSSSMIQYVDTLSPFNHLKVESNYDRLTVNGYPVISIECAANGFLYCIALNERPIC